MLLLSCETLQSVHPAASVGQADGKENRGLGMVLLTVVGLILMIAQIVVAIRKK